MEYIELPMENIELPMAIRAPIGTELPMVIRAPDQVY